MGADDIEAQMRSMLRQVNKENEVSANVRTALVGPAFVSAMLGITHEDALLWLERHATPIEEAGGILWEITAHPLSGRADDPTSN